MYINITSQTNVYKLTKIKDGKNHFSQGTLGGELTVLRRKIALRAAQCTSLTFITGKERCTLSRVERVLLAKLLKKDTRRTGCYGGFHAEL